MASGRASQPQVWASRPDIRSSPSAWAWASHLRGCSSWISWNNPLPYARCLQSQAMVSSHRQQPVLRSCAHLNWPLRVEPFLYETIICKLFPYNPPDHHRMLTIHGNSVRHLFLRDPMSFMSAWNYLHSCQNLRMISLFSDELAKNPLPPDGSSWSSFRSQCPNTFPVYQHLTHLELFTSLSPLYWIDWLASLPNLTHLHILSPMKDINPAVESILARCPKIRVMLWCPWQRRFSDSGEPTQEQIRAINLREPEPRLVVCKISYEQHTKYFIVHAERKSSDTKTVWKAAEDIINKRRWVVTVTFQSMLSISNYLEKLERQTMQTLWMVRSLQHPQACRSWFGKQGGPGPVSSSSNRTVSSYTQPTL